MKGGKRQPETLTPEQMRQIETDYRDGLAAIGRKDSERVLAEESSGRAKAGALLSRKGLLQMGRQVLLLYDLLRDWWDGEYALPWKTAAAVTGALLYFINPFDVVPDCIPVVGYLDDAVVIGACLRLIRADLKAYVAARDLKPEDYGL